MEDITREQYEEALQIVRDYKYYLIEKQKKEVERIVLQNEDAALNIETKISHVDFPGDIRGLIDRMEWTSRFETTIGDLSVLSMSKLKMSHGWGKKRIDTLNNILIKAGTSLKP